MKRKRGFGWYLPNVDSNYMPATLEILQNELSPILWGWNPSCFPNTVVWENLTRNVSVWFPNTLTVSWGSITHTKTFGDMLGCSRSDCWGWTGAMDATRPMAGFAPSHLTLLNKWRIFQTPVSLDEEESFKRKSEIGNTGFQYLSSIIPRWARLSTRFYQGLSNAINPKCCQTNPTALSGEGEDQLSMVKTASSP